MLFSFETSLSLIFTTSSVPLALAKRILRATDPSPTRLVAGSRKTAPRRGRALLRLVHQDPSPYGSGFRQRARTPAKRLKFPVIIPRGSHPFPSRTRKLSLA